MDCTNLGDTKKPETASHRGGLIFDDLVDHVGDFGRDDRACPEAVVHFERQVDRRGDDVTTLRLVHQLPRPLQKLELFVFE